MRTLQRHSTWYASSEADMRAFLNRLPFEREDVKSDFAYYLARLRYVAQTTSLKVEEILQETTDRRIQTHALLLRLLIDNLASADRELIRLEWPRKQEGAS